MESSQLMYTGYNGTFVNDSQMFESFPEQSIYSSNMDYGMYQNNKMQQEDVRILQGGDMGGYAMGDEVFDGNWMGNMEQSTQKYCAPSTQQTQYFGLAASFPQPLLSLGSDFEYTPAAFSYADSVVYSNESSPCLHSYDMHLSAPHSPMIPSTPPSQMYSAPGSFYADYYSTQQYPLQHTGAGYAQPSTYEMSFGYAQEPQSLETGYSQHVEMQAQQQEEEDDGPELVGMGLYDDLPELSHSTLSSPALLCQQSPPMLGRGLVLEQSFGLPEDHEDDDEEEDEEEEDEEEEDCDSAYNQDMQY